MKQRLPVSVGLVRCLATFCAVIFAVAARAGVSYTVTTTSDSHAVNPSLSPLDGGGQISLRSATESVNAQDVAFTITVPPGNYSLSLGELDLSTNGNQTGSVFGAGAAATTVTQTDPTNRVFNIDQYSLGGTTTTLSGLTIQGGHDGADNLGGAGILAGSITNVTKDVLNLDNCVIQNNQCTTNATWEPGGGVQMAGGDLNVSSCVFSNNTSGESFGAAIFTLAQSVVSLLNVTNSLFVNNGLTNSSGAGPDGGGAIMIETPANSIHNIVGCVFTNNRVVGALGNTYGGAIQINGGGLNIGSSTFVSNSVTGAGGLGGAIYVDSGTNNMSFCRLAGNAASNGGGALYDHASNGALTVALNDWWGCNGGPGAAGCDVAGGDGSASTLVYSPWLVITNTANPGSILMGQSTTLTASVLQNSIGQTLSASQVGVLIGLPLSWNPGPHGNLSAVQTTIQVNGTATAIFANDNTCNPGVPTVTLDNGTATAMVVVQCPDLTISKTNNVSGSVTLGNNWTWTVHVANAGLSPASFPSGSTIALDNLPVSNISYGAPGILNISNISGMLSPGIDAGNNLTVTASGAVTVNAGGSFDVQVTAVPAATGTFINPQAGGVCTVDPNRIIPESNEGNNLATNTVVVSCPTIAATLTGNTNICPGGSAIITVSIAGGTPPYAVTLSNGGGTQTGASPLIFNVNPAATTTYNISSSADAYGCPVTDSGSFTVTVTPLAPPVISLSPPGVFANSAGNQASVPAGYSSYAWTILNGTIIGPANQPLVTYVAGSTNNVSLSVTVFNSFGCDAVSSTIVPVITGFSVHTNVAFKDALGIHPMGFAFDGTNYWSCSGGGSTGTRLAGYALTGALVATNAPGLDFRSLCTRPDGTLLARAFNNNVIYQQTSPGVFAPSGITLNGGTLNSQSSVVLNGAGTEFDAMNAGVVSRWDTNGVYLGSVNLIGFGNLAGENTYPQNRGLAAMDNLWLTYNDADILSIWDTNGNRIAQLSLAGAGAVPDSALSFSYANGKVFIDDAAGGTWRGFDLYSAARVAVYGAPYTNTWNSEVQNKIAGTGLIPAVDAFMVTGTNPVPNLANLRNYQSVLVYSDQPFSDNAGLGNALADYIDQGGGVALGTFAFADTGGLSIQGRISTNGDLCFTAGGQTTGSSLAMIKDLPLDPLLDGVNTFNGGGSSYHDSPTTNAPGATQVAHWPDGQSLIGRKVDGFGRFAGLNFYPPSSDSRSDFWVSSTDGARLMANALLWSGQIPPNILSAPADQELPLGTTATFNVFATGTSPFSYQWRLNGTNLPSATNSTLSVLVQSGQFGAYSVVVSNLYGATTSLSGLLNPPLRFLNPVVSSNIFSLFLVNADGSPVAGNRAPRVQIFSASDPAFALWSLLTNPVVPSGTELRADGLSATNSAPTLYRAVEAP